ncbi:MAG: hypothetical protein HY471_01935 [Candidatus Sungbacteria bacterium]|nr:hypothetical protein [Candidatus Sungbacteria bacterium]
MKQSHARYNRGITLLLVILVMSGLMTVSIGIFNVSFAELRISGELTSSFRAFYAADRLFEYALRRDRGNDGPLCESDSPDTETACYTICTENMPGCPPEGDAVDIIPEFIGPNGASVGCAKVTIIRPAGGLTTVRATGQYDCAQGSLRVVRRAFEVSY